MKILKRAIIFSLVFIVIIIIASVFFEDRWQYSRSLNCEMQHNGRAQNICKSIERNLKYTCCGHAIIHPGYRPTWITIKKVWCEQQINREDIELLHDFKGSKDWRLLSASDSLLRLLTGKNEYGSPEPETSIFHPDNSSYLLKGGCRKNTLND